MPIYNHTNRTLTINFGEEREPGMAKVKLWYAVDLMIHMKRRFRGDISAGDAGFRGGESRSVENLIISTWKRDGKTPAIPRDPRKFFD